MNIRKALVAVTRQTRGPPTRRAFPFVGSAVTSYECRHSGTDRLFGNTPNARKTPSDAGRKPLDVKE